MKICLLLILYRCMSSENAKFHDKLMKIFQFPLKTEDGFVSSTAKMNNLKQILIHLRQT